MEVLVLILLGAGAYWVYRSWRQQSRTEEPRQQPVERSTRVRAQEPPRRRRRPSRESLTATRQPFAVLDLETTGLQPTRHRIVEVAVIQLDEDLNFERQWCTVVNPGGPVKGTSIHGIRELDVRGAPTFEAVVPAVTSLLRGRVPVAHNAPFDIGFLEAEFARAGFTLPRLQPVDTYRATGMKLSDACFEYGVALEQAHTALDDARATAELFRRLVTRGSLARYPQAVPADRWPAISCDELVEHRRRPLKPAPASPACPHCFVEWEEPPARSRKCAACGERVVVRRRKFDGTTFFLTVEGAEKFDSEN